MPENKDKLADEYVLEYGSNATAEEQAIIREAFLRGFNGEKAGKLKPDAYLAYKAGQRYGGIK